MGIAAQALRLSAVPGAAIVLAIAIAVPAAAQSDRGGITGRVSDPQNAVVGGAKVVAKDVETGTEHRTITTATGDYTLSSLPARLYDLTIEAAGFKTFLRAGLRVQVAQATRLDATLDIGTTVETVTVTGEASLLKTDNAQQGINVSGDRINELPLNFGGGGGNVGAIRNWLGFVTLAPGVSGTNERASVNGAPGRRVQDLPGRAGRHQLERHRLDEHGRRRVGRDDRRVLDADRQLLGRVRPGAGRCLQLHDQVGHQRAARQPLRLHDPRGARRPSSVHRRPPAQPQAQFRVQRRRSRSTSPACISGGTRLSSSPTWKASATGRTRPAPAPRCRPRPTATVTSARAGAGRVRPVAEHFQVGEEERLVPPEVESGDVDGTAGAEPEIVLAAERERASERTMGVERSLVTSS